MPGFHERGRADYLKGKDVEELRAEEKRLRRRIVRLCRPKGILGHFALAYGKWRLVWKLRARFDGRDAMFLGNGVTSDCGRLAVGRP
ncbi:MAG TPA: hypothetical protein VM511_00265 [Luteolibacter sp.]|nr:hypothetical protein [Luteolibacter sp.]